MRLSKFCIDCNKVIDYRSIRCKSCTCINRNTTRNYNKGVKNPQWKSPNEIPYSWFSKYFERSNRKRTGNITITDVYNLWIHQDKKCALSGVIIGFNDDGNGHTCSIDRIDSKKNYLLDNIQLVHKDINLMKNKFEQKYFIDMCKKIAGEACEV